MLLVADGARIRARGARFVAGVLALAGFVLSLVLVAAGIDDLITRNMIALWLPGALLVAGGLARRRGRASLGVVGAARRCARSALTAAVGVAFDRNVPAPRLARGRRVLGRATPPAGGRGDPHPALPHLLPLSLYLPG